MDLLERVVEARDARPAHGDLERHALLMVLDVVERGLAEHEVAFGLVERRPVGDGATEVRGEDPGTVVVLVADVRAVVRGLAVRRRERASEVVRHVHGPVEPAAVVPQPGRDADRRGQGPGREPDQPLLPWPVAPEQHQRREHEREREDELRSGQPREPAPEPEPGGPPPARRVQEPVREQDERRGGEDRRGLGEQHAVVHPEVRRDRGEERRDQPDPRSRDLAPGQTAERRPCLPRARTTTPCAPSGSRRVPARRATGSRARACRGAGGPPTGAPRAAGTGR